MPDDFCKNISELKSYLEKYMYQSQEKTSAISNSIHNLNSSFIHHLYFQLLQEELKSCKK